MKNVLITGGAGFIGSNFIRHILTRKENITVVNLDVLTYAGNPDNLIDCASDRRYSFIQGDINDSQLACKIFHQYEIDTVVNFAAETHVDRSLSGPTDFIRTNIDGTFSLLEEAKKFWLEEGFIKRATVRFHHISTDEVFGSLGADEPAFHESSPYRPHSPYSASKAASDHLVMSYFYSYNLPVSITNCSNNYGPNQYPEKLIPLMIINALNGNMLPVYGDGKQIRDWIYVEDHCEAIDLVIEKGAPGATYVIGGNNQPTNLEIVETICRLMDGYLPDRVQKPCRSLIQFVEDRPGHDRRYAMNIEKIHRELGWHPSETLDTGMKKTIEWYLKNPKWIRDVLGRSEYQDWIGKNYNHRGNYS